MRGRVQVLPRGIVFPTEIVVGLSMVEWFGRGRRGRVQAQPRGIGSIVVLSVSEYVGLSGRLSVESALARGIVVGVAVVTVAF